MENKIVITGGAGFLGSHLCELLLKENKKVTCIDNLSSGNIRNIEPYFKDRNFHFLNHDITSPLLLEDTDEIYNLACPASPIQYQKDPIQTLKTNVYGAFNMLEAARRQSAKILQTSTSEVYGNPSVHPQPEKYCGYVNPIGLRACYDEGKRAAETLFFDYHRQYNIHIKVARLFNCYGPRMQMYDGRVIPNFILQALQNQPLTIHGSGQQTRSFCYVSDTINGLIALMALENFTGPLNIGTQHEIRMVDLAELIISMTGSRSKLIFKASVSDDPERRKPDITLAQSLIQWQPQVTLEQGLTQTIIDFENRLRPLQAAS